MATRYVVALYRKHDGEHQGDVFARWPTSSDGKHRILVEDTEKEDAEYVAKQMQLQFGKKYNYVVEQIDL